MNKFALILVTIILLTGTSCTLAQSRRRETEKILVAADPPLTQKRVDDLVEFFEWVLNAEFNAAERVRFRKILVESWREDAKESAKSFEVIEKVAQQVNSLSPERRVEAQPEMEKNFLEGMEKDEPSELNKLLREIHDRARETDGQENNAGSDSPKNDSNNKTGSGGLSELAGEWSTSEQGLSLLRNGAKDVFANAGSSVRSFKISADGRVEFAAFFTQSLSSCVTKIFRTSAGKVSVSGDRLTFDYAPGKVQSQSDCDQSRNYTKTIEAERQVFTFTLEPFNNGLKLCLLDANNANYCVYKK